MCLAALGACSGSIERGADLGISAFPTTITFSAVPVGGSSQETIIVSHRGQSGTLVLEPATIETTSPDLTIEGPAKTELQPGESTEIVVHYAPTDTVYDAGIVTIRHNIGEKPPIKVAVQSVEQAPVLLANPQLLDFGNVSAGTVLEKSIVVSNDGTAPMHIDNVKIEITGGAPFELVSGPEVPAVVPIGGTTKLTVRFSPALEGDDAVYENNLRFLTDHPVTNNRAVKIRGRSRHAQLVIVPPVIDFGWVAAKKSALREVVVKNGGSDPVTINALSLVAPHEALTLLEPPAMPFKLQPGEPLNLTLKFAPSGPVNEPGAHLGALAIASDDYVTPDRTVEVRGRGAEPAVKLVPEDYLDFGVVGAGYQHQRTVEVVNIGFIPLVLSGVEIAPDSSPGFTVLGAPKLPVTLAQGGRAEVNLVYTNLDVDEEESFGGLAVTTDDPVMPTVSLTLHARNTAVAGCVPYFEPPVVKFGAVATGTKMVKTFQLRNEGSLPCTFQTAAFVDCKSPDGLCEPQLGQSQVFHVGDGAPPSGSAVFYGDSLEIPVEYVPVKDLGDDAGLTVLTLVNGVPPGPFKQYHQQAGGVMPTLLGSVGDAGIVAKPHDLAFGLTTIGCGSKPQVSMISRVGPLAISLGKVTDDCGGNVHWKALPPLPYALFEDPEVALPMTLQFAPVVPGFTKCTISLVPDNPESGMGAINVSGFGTAETTRTDYYQQAPEFTADILFIVDSSGSMSDEQAALVAGFDGFVAQAKVWNVSYHIGVVTTDIEHDYGWLRGTPRWVTNADPSGFAQNATVGTQGSGDERGLQAASMALDPGVLMDSGTACAGWGACDGGAGWRCTSGTCGGPNHGFLRPEATLTIIWLSDEEDHSAVEDVADYVSFFKSVKPGGKVRGYAIVGDPVTEQNPAGGCQNAENPNPGPWGGKGLGADPGLRYIAAAEALGGAWYSICAFGKENQGQPPLLDQIGKDAFTPETAFKLSEPADPTSIQVFVNDVPCTSGWTFDAEKNAIVYDEDSPCFPGPNALLKIVYKPICYPLE